jgi:hypothetical protein
VLLALLLQTLPAKYAPAPWFFRWAENLPLHVVVGLAVVFGVAWLVKEPLQAFITKVLDGFVERIKRSSKEPASAEDLKRKAQKAVVLEQAAERLRIELNCDHVEVYGCQNGEYLRSGEGVDKFVMQAEAPKPGDPRYMDMERMLFASDLPRLILALESQPYLLLWQNRCDDWKANKLMVERNYNSTLAVFLRRPLKPGAAETGIIGLVLVSWRDTELFRPDQSGCLPASHHGPIRQIDTELEQHLLSYAREFSYSM